MTPATLNLYRKVAMSTTEGEGNGENVRQLRTAPGDPGEQLDQALANAEEGGGTATATADAGVPPPDMGDAAKSTLIAANQCPECAEAGLENTFSSPQALAAHRSRTHNIKGSSKRSSARSTKAKNGKGKQDFDASKFLKMMFPNGIPPETEMLQAVQDWIGHSERLWGQSAKFRN